MPGILINQGLKNMCPLPSAIISPQDGVGGCTPKPRKENAASKRIALATSNVATTITAFAMFGRTSVIRIRMREHPAASAAVM